jgi:hypothetical protein
MLLIIVPTPARATADALDQSDLFQPDVFPSQEAAAKGLARKLVSALTGAKEFDPQQHAIVLAGDASADAMTRVVETLSDEFPSLCVTVARSEEAQRGDASVIGIELRVTVSEKLPSPFRSRRELPAGTVTMTVSGPMTGQRVLTARYVDKPWVDDWASFTNSETKGRWLRGQTEHAVPTESEALARAHSAAAKALWPRVRQQMNERNAGRPGAIMVSEKWVCRQLESLLGRGKHVTDVFIQSYERPYGRVRRASILVDASADDIDAMAVYCAKMARAEFGGKAVTWGATAAMSAVILLLYFFVNSVTKGYFAWRLRAVALLLGIAGILIVLAVR